jgi:hypothetical protein
MLATEQARAIKLRRQTAALSSRSSRGSEPDKGGLRRNNWRGFATCRDALRRALPNRGVAGHDRLARSARIGLRR